MHATLDPDVEIPTQPFQVLVLYDTAASGASAVSTYRRLTHSLEHVYSFNLKLWRLDVLDAPARALWATRDVAESDMIIVAWASPRTALSSQRAWAGQWPTGSWGARRVLVSLFTRPATEAEDSGVRTEREFLQTVAQRTGLDLISWPPNPLNGLAKHVEVPSRAALRPAAYLY